MIIHLIAGLIKILLYKMSQYFPKPYEPLGGEINVRVDLSNYATKANSIKCNRCWYIIFFKKKTDLINLKSNVDQLDIDKL